MLPFLEEIDAETTFVTVRSEAFGLDKRETVW